MNDPRKTARRWLDTAREDLAFARHAARHEFHPQACFHAHQAAEKAVKAMHYAQGARSVLGHGIRHLIERLGISGLERLLPFARDLDLYYIPARYPNGLDSGIPSEAFGATQSTQAVAIATEIFRASEELIGKQEDRA